MRRGPRLELYKDKAFFHRWRLIAPNGKIIADSGEAYSSHDACLRAAKKLREAAVNATIEYAHAPTNGPAR